MVMAYCPIENLSDFNSQVTLGETPEGLHLEFKREIVWRKGQQGKPTDQRELCRDIAQFANTEGGVLLIGVVEKKVGDLKVAANVHPVDDPDGLKGWLENAITKYLVPNTLSKMIVTIQHPDGVVLAVNVPPSVHLVAVWNQHEKKQGIEYLYRTNRGKEWMNPDMAERHLMNSSRAARLRIKEIFESEKGPSGELEIVPPPTKATLQGRQALPGAGARLQAVDDNTFAILVAGLPLNVPYDLVKAAWLTTDKRPAVALDASVVVTDRKAMLRF